MNRQRTVWNRPEPEPEPKTFESGSKWNRNGTGPTRTVAITNEDPLWQQKKEQHYNFPNIYQKKFSYSLPYLLEAHLHYQHIVPTNIQFSTHF
jgi:hypothetical protein